MADDRVPPPDNTAGHTPMDATRPMSPVDGEETPDAGATRAFPAATAAGAATQAFPAATQAFPAATAATGAGSAAPPAPDATAAMPAVDAPGELGPDAAAAPERWSGRAGVPAPGTPGIRQPSFAVEEQDAPSDPYGGRSWFTPILFGTLALILVAVLGVGIWLILRANRATTPAEQASAEPAVTASVAPTPSSAPATSAAPSLQSSAAAPTTAAPVAVSVTDVRGMTRPEATRALQDQGLVVSVSERPDTSVPPGLVVGTDPAAGSPAQPGDHVTLIVAAAARTSAAPTTAAAAKPSTSGD